MTVNLLIRDIPEEARDTLAERARARGQSLQAYLYELVTGEARRGANLALLDAVRRSGRGRTDVSAEGTVAELAELRARREANLSVPRDPQ
ncbi:MAG: hypothetical protein H0W37_06540 [Pseudonocardiales bacterium]|jgi:hypothetical protein|nr:hypothetical protein [Pseudonocardiales bacterium]